MESLAISTSQVTVPDSKDGNQYINMKVLRLLKPLLIPNELLNCKFDDGTTACGMFRGRTDGGLESLQSSSSDSVFALTEQLILPQSFGVMFLGQALHCYACISNTTTSPIRDIMVKLEFQVQSATATRSEMVLNEGKQFTLEPQNTYDFVINREVRDLGAHMMVASITYTNPLNPSERLSVKKCFRYTVTRPMDFKNKFVSLPDGGYLGEFHVQNLTGTSIVLENVRMITSPEYYAEELDVLSSISPIDQLTIRNLLGPNDSRQFVFRIHLKDQSKTGEMLKSSTSPGKVEILWRSRMGDLGKVMTSPLSRTIPDLKDVFITFSQKPAKVKLHEAFAVTVAVFSLCNRSMEFLIKLLDPEDRPFAWCGVSGRTVGTLIPGGMLEFLLPVVACNPGLHLFPRFQLIDKLTGKSIDSDDLAEIYVEA